MRPIRTYTVVPVLPPPLARLRDVAYNLRWAWDHETIELFRRLDSDLWESAGHNPILMLGTIQQAQLEAAAADDGFLSHLERVSADLDAYLAPDSTWFRRTHGALSRPLVAYFCAEFGVTECLSLFAGGLGVLAGDHLKSASDLGVPLVGVGLLYQQGYFRQYLNASGWQQEAYEDNDFHNLPIVLERQPDGTPVTIEVSCPGRPVVAQVWRAQVGRVPLYLLDTNTPANERPEDRDISDQLYGGDLDVRLRQEIVLGVGGYRALHSLGLHPSVYHMNEGHAAFLALEHVRWLMDTRGVSFSEAREAASASLVFTTHTMVPAGHDYFPPTLMDRYFTEYSHNMGLSREEFLALGREDQRSEGDPFCMTILAMRMAAYSNGVSRLHGEVTRRSWQRLWPQVPVEELPIAHVDNGVHSLSWISREMKQLYDRYLGLRWREEPADRAVWQRAERIAAEELWHTHERRRERLVSFSRRRLQEQLRRRGGSAAEIEGAAAALDSEALTIGFARRFATYKRATLLFHDPERLARILSDPKRPVQIVVAGKAHPRDDAGKDLIRQVTGFAAEDRFRRRVVFLEDYDMALARYLVQGVDVWLNTPRRPNEASGTSGMKAAANGVLNVSVLDGWWDEAYQPDVGWVIGRRETYESEERQDEVEAAALYALFEQEVVPAFYERGADGLPHRWVTHMKAAMGCLCPYFNTNRMVGEYSERCYTPAAFRFGQLTDSAMARAKALAAWKARILSGWTDVSIASVEAGDVSQVQVHSGVQVRARVRLGSLAPDDVQVELYMGRVDGGGEIVEAEALPMERVRQDADGWHAYAAQAVAETSGLHGYTVRVLPHHPDLTTRFLPGLIAWASGA